jgi:peptidoglycan/LPS O-acetylase OafA/YrhL
VPLWSWLVRRVLGQGRSTLAIEAGCLVALGAAGYVARSLFSLASGTTRGLSFLWLPTNLDLFATGMLIAVLHAWVTGPGRDTVWAGRVKRYLGGAPLAWAAAFVGVYLLYAYKVGQTDFVTGYQGFFWQRRQFTITVLAACLIIPMVFGGRDKDSREPVTWFWQWRPVAWVGMVSYGLYLWHFPLMQRVVSPVDPFGKTMWKGWADSAPGNTSVLVLLAVGFGGGLAVAGLSWYLLERPLQRFKRLI